MAIELDVNTEIYNIEKDAFYKLVLASSVNADGSDTFDIIRYENEGSLQKWISEREEKIQCKVGINVDFGQSQHPALDDFADGVNTYDFLVNLA